MKVKKTSALILEQIKRLIKNHTFPPGEKLPSEATLSEMFSVSRAPLREALNVLSTLGVVESVQGGGTWVKNVDIDDLLKKASIEMISYEQMKELLEFRIIIETEAARLAATKRTNNDLINIRNCLEEIKKSPKEDFLNAGNKMDYNFHNAIVQASSNSFLVHSVKNISHLYLELMMFSSEYSKDLKQKKESLFTEHYEIYNAIKNRNSEIAAIYMKQHLERIKAKLDNLIN